MSGVGVRRYDVDRERRIWANCAHPTGFTEDARSWCDVGVTASELLMPFPRSDRPDQLLHECSETEQITTHMISPQQPDRLNNGPFLREF